MLCKLKHLWKNNEGVEAVEMAFVLPIFLLFVLGIVEFGRAYWIMDSMQLSIDEAGRYAMLNTTATDVQIVATAKANLYGLNANDFTVTSTSETISGVNYKRIMATYSFHFSVPNLLPFGNLTLTRQTAVPIL